MKRHPKQSDGPALEDGPEPETTRKPEVYGRPFPLADGRPWHLAAPRLRYRLRVIPADPGDPASVERSEVDAVWTYGYGSPTNGLVAALVESIELGGDVMTPAFRLALDLIRQCHEITGSQAAELLDMSAEEAEDLAVGLLRMVRGLDPFPTEQTQAKVD